MTGYVYQEYPKWKYHPDKEPVMVPDAIEEEALGPDWFDRPDEAQRKKEELAAQLKKLEQKKQNDWH